jgi:hypothetical protein
VEVTRRAPHNDMAKPDPPALSGLNHHHVEVITRFLPGLFLKRIKPFEMLRKFELEPVIIHN